MKDLSKISKSKGEAKMLKIYVDTLVSVIWLSVTTVELFQMKKILRKMKMV